ncbi:MAG: HD domain-containing phosphohydrolase, partial [Terriglobales bacterium]
MSKRATFFILTTATIGMLVLAHSLWYWQSSDLARFICYLLIATLASGLKIQLPGIDGTMSVNFLFILLGVLEMSMSETLIIGCTASLAQCVWWARTKPDPAKLVFNVLSMMANAIAISYIAFHRLERVLGGSTPLLLVITALIFFLANTLPVTIIISLTEGKSPRKVWSECYFWSFPYYLVGAAIVFFVDFVNKHTGWQASFMVLPVIYWVYRSYRLYLGRLEAEKKHVETEKRHAEDVAKLHLRTIEALALAIEAKDHTTHKHLQRVRVYAIEIAKELGFSPEDIEALCAAALLHDIGKLAVPEHIINKPGRLT